jgi:hypothetical protein
MVMNTRTDRYRLSLILVGLMLVIVVVIAMGDGLALQRSAAQGNPTQTVAAAGAVDLPTSAATPIPYFTETWQTPELPGTPKITPLPTRTP